MSPRRFRMWPAAVLLLAAASGVEAQSFSYTGAASYSAGNYVFDARSDSWVLTNALRMRAGPVDVSASFPFVVWNGGLVTTVAGGVTLPTGGTESGTVARRGSGETIGTRGSGRRGGGSTVPVDTVTFASAYSARFADPYLSIDGELSSGFGTVRSVRVNVAAKAPMADVDSGLSSGEWDLGIGGSLVVGSGRVLFLADASYWWMGGMPDVELGDALSYAVGVSTAAFSGRGSVMATVSGMTRTIETMDAPVLLSASVGHGAGARSLLSATAGFGLTESAPDLYLALGWSVRLGSTAAF